MKETKIQELIIQEDPHLHKILDPDQAKKFKEMAPELRDSFIKRQMFRTKTEMEFSVLNDAKFPTNGAKYWQAVREQSTHMENLMHLSFEYRKNEVEIKKLEKKLEKEKDELEKESIQVSIDEKSFTKATMQLIAAHRAREITQWSDFKKLYNDGTFDDKDPDTHQLQSYKKIIKNRENTLSPGSSQPEIFNVLGQKITIDRIETERKTLKAEKREAIEIKKK